MFAIAYVIIGSIVSSDANVRDLSVCWNYCFRIIFGFKRYESVKQLQFLCVELSFYLLYTEIFKWCRIAF